MRRLCSAPRNAQIDEIEEKFAAINGYISKAGGWLVSVPGDVDMRFQALPGSGLPAALRDLGYIVEKDRGDAKDIAACCDRAV